MEILDRVDLNKLRLQMIMEGTIALEEEDAELKSSRIGDVKAPAEEEKRSLREILDIVNEPYKGFLDDHDIVLRPLNHLMLTDEKINEAVRSGNSYGVLRELFSERAQDLVLDMSGKGIDLYFIINNRELTTRGGSADTATFSDCMFGHESLKRLKHTTDARYFRFRDYLDKVRGWRNEEAHSAPEIPDAELREAVHILVTMYAYVIAKSFPDLMG